MKVVKWVCGREVGGDEGWEEVVGEVGRGGSGRRGGREGRATKDMQMIGSGVLIREGGHVIQT